MLVSRLVSIPRNNLLHSSLHRDIILGFLLLLLIGLATSLLAEHVFDRQTSFINLVNTAGRLRMLSQRIAFIAHRVDSDPRQPNSEQQELRQLIARFEQDLGELERVNQEMGAFVIGHGDGDEGLAIIREQWPNYRRAAETVIAMNPQSPRFIAALRTIDDAALPLLAAAENNLRHIIERSNSDRVDLRVVMLTILMMGALFLLVSFIYMRRRLLGPYSIISRMAYNLAAGDFSARAEYDGRGEVGALVKRLNQTAAALQNLFAERLRVEEALRQEITGHKITEEQLRTLSMTVDNPCWMTGGHHITGHCNMSIAELTPLIESIRGSLNKDEVE